MLGINLKLSNLTRQPSSPVNLDRIIARGGAAPLSVYSNSAWDRCETRKAFKLGGEAASSIRVVFANIYISDPSFLGSGVSDGGEANGPNDITIECGCEISGTTVMFTFDGAATKTLAPGDIVVSDAILPAAFSAANFAAGTAGFIRTGLTVTGTDNWVQIAGADIGETGDKTVASAGASSQIDDTGALATPAGGNVTVRGLIPVGIIGEWATDADVSLLVMGDSIVAGADDITYNSTDGGGFVMDGTRLVGGRMIATVKMARGADRANSYTAYAHPLRYHMMQYATHLIENYGTNDMGAGFSMAATLASRQAIWADFRVASPLGYVIAVPIAPKGSSSDSWVTTANQTATSGFGSGGASRDPMNANLLSLVGEATGPDEYMNVNSVWQDTAATDKWAVDGNANYATDDGIHPSAAVHGLAGALLGANAAFWSATGRVTLADLPTPTFNLDAASLIASLDTGDAVSSWADKTGNLTMSAGGAGVYDVQALGGMLPGVQFTSGDYLDSPGDIAFANGHIFTVLQRDIDNGNLQQTFLYKYGGSAREYWLYLQSDAWRFISSLDGTNGTQVLVATGHTDTPGTPTFIHTVCDGVNIIVTVDDDTPDTSALASMYDGTEVFRLGSSSTTTRMDGTISHVLRFASLTTQQVADVKDLLRRKWGVTV